MNSDNFLEIKSIKDMYDSVISEIQYESINVTKSKIVALQGGNGHVKSTT